ncbi:hypothetical protein SVAN01_00995 [Stagonosporopsis vannaccii]|nr:hypothetical protein SVAN01_00995 [Stagonosporopsis vannaccii]
MEAAATLKTNFVAASHAHPLPATPAPRAVEEQRLRAMIARHSIVVKLQKLSCERAPTVTDVLLPKTRRSRFDENKIASSLDHTECWKGLSHSQATELTMWYHFFYMCLQEEVRMNLCEGLVKSLLQIEQPVDEVYLLPRMLDSLWSRRRCVFDINFVDLIDNMMGMFHDRFPSEAASLASNWSHFSGSLSRFLYNFLRVQDCFCNSLTGPCLEVVFDFQCSESVIIATGVVTWQTPEVRFLNLSNCLAAGEEYRITPFAPSNDLKASHPRRSSNHYVDETIYTISRSSLSFNWDPVSKGFVTVLPANLQDKPHIAETIVNACTTTLFPDNIKFERQSRWSIKVRIRPAGSNPEPWSAITTMTAEHSGVDDGDYDLAGRAVCTALGELNQTTALPGASWGTSVRAAQKRKVSKPEVAAESCEFKRRCHGSARDKLAFDTRFGDEMKWESSRSHLFEGANDADTDSGCSDAEVHGDDQPEERPLSAPLPTLHRQTYQGDCGFWSPVALSSDSDSSVPHHAIVVDLISEQQRIRRNYQEFADRKLSKTSGLIDSPVSEGEFQAYERIFMEGSEMNSPVTDGSAVELDAVMEGV